MTIPDGFRLVERPWGNAWLHMDAPVWVVLYPGIPTSMTHRYDSWQAYEAIEGCHGRDPWTVNNRKLGPDRGWPTSDEAFKAATNAAEARAKDDSSSPMAPVLSAALAADIYTDER